MRKNRCRDSEKRRAAAAAKGNETGDKVCTKPPTGSARKARPITRRECNTTARLAAEKPLCLRDLKPDAHNARRHTPRNLGAIESALREVGAARSIVIDEKGVVLAGNATIEAAAAAGIQKVQVVDADGSTIVAVRRRGLTPLQKTRLALYDNRSAELAEWDEEVLAALRAKTPDALGGMFSEEELSELLRKLNAGDGQEIDAEPQIDRAEELQKEWKTARGQIWELGEHRLMCADSTNAADVRALLGDERPFIMVTDPPYGVDYDPNWRNEAAAGGHLSYGARAVGRVYNDDRADWSQAWALFPGDVAYTWSPGGDGVLVTGAALQSSGFQIRSMLMWRKTHFAISRGAYHYQHEPCWYAVRKGAKARWCGDRSQSSVWEIDHRKNDTGHSTQKPVECMARPIRNHGAEGDVVYEPFAGSGTTIIACEQVKRRCRAIEISPGYVAVTLQRWADATGKTPERLKS